MIGAESLYHTFNNTVLMGFFIWIGVAMRMGYRQGAFLLGHFRNSHLVKSARIYQNLGPFRNIQLISSICLVVTLPKNLTKRGDLDPEELASLPRPIRRQLRWLGFTLLTLWGSLCLSWLVGFFGDWA